MSRKLSPIINLAGDARSILQEKGLRPKKHLGQNFLINNKVLTDIIDVAELNPGDLVLEIGAGLGILTQALIDKSCQVLAIEKDPDLFNILKQRFDHINNVTILNQDVRCFLKENPDLSRYKIVANLPFYLTSHLIVSMITLVHLPSTIIIMIQKEVAERICAKPPKSNRLAMMCQFRGDCQIIQNVSSSDFWPKPEVSAAILKISNIEKHSFDQDLMNLIEIGFSSPRKTLLNNLKSLGIDSHFLSECGFNEKIRAEALDKNNWLKLLYCFLKKKNAIIKEK